MTGDMSAKLTEQQQWVATLAARALHAQLSVLDGIEPRRNGSVVTVGRAQFNGHEYSIVFTDSDGQIRTIQFPEGATFGTLAHILRALEG